MKQTVKLLVAEGKLALWNLPKIFAGILLFGVLIFGAYAASDTDMENLTVSIGVVLPEDPASQLAFSFVTTSAGSFEHISFHPTTYEDGVQQLKNNELTALLVIPDGFVQEVMYGTVPELEVYLSDQMGMESLLFQEMAESCIGIIYDTQVGSNAAHQFAKEHGYEYAMDDHGEEIAFSYLNFLFKRLTIFEREEISSSLYDSSLLRASSAVSLLLIFSGISCSGLFLWDKSGFSSYRRHQGISDFSIKGVKSLGMFAGLQIPFFLVTILAETLGFLPVANLGIFLFLMELALLFVSILTMAVYELTKDLVSSVLILFLGGFLFTFLGGGLLPASLMPDSFLLASKFLPAYGLTQTIAGAISGSISEKGLLSLLLYGMFFFFLPNARHKIAGKEEKS